MKIYGLKSGGLLEFTPEQEQAEERFISSIKDGSSVCRETTVWRSKATSAQRGAYFGLLVANVISQANEEAIDTSSFLKLMCQDDLPSGVPLSKDAVYHLLLSLCPIYDENHRKLSLSKMNTEQAAKFFSDCQNLLCSRGIYIPDPDKDWRKHEPTNR